MIKCSTCNTELTDLNWSGSWKSVNRKQCKGCSAKYNSDSNANRMYVNGKYIHHTHPLYKPGRYKTFDDAAFSSLINYTQCTKGEVYIIKNPAWKSWYKIGKAVDAEDRCKGYQTGSPLRDYELLYSFNTNNRNKAEIEAHKKAEKICLERRGEWFYTKNLNELIEGITP